MAGMYTVYHGPDGIKNISKNIYTLTQTLAKEITLLGYKINYENYFDTIVISSGTKELNIERIRSEALKNKIFANETKKCLKRL